MRLCWITQHYWDTAIVVSQEENGKQSLVGIFSASKIARQLGVQTQTYEMARTFAEIEVVIAGV